MKNKVHSETQLIRRCLKGKLEAQKELYERYAGRLMTICRRYARDNMEAEDIMQEGFIKIFKNLKKFRGEGSLFGWMKTIMVHTALRYIKKSFRWANTEDFKPVAQPPVALSNLNAEDLIHHIQRLPTGYQTIFNLYHIEGYSHKEIAHLLDIGESTSRSQLTKARKMLQTRIVDFESIKL